MFENAPRRLSPALVGALVLAGPLIACDAAQRAAAGPSPTLADGPRATLADGTRAISAISTRATAHRRGTLRGGERVERVVTWPDRPADSDTRMSLRPDALAAVDRAPVPVLAPPAEWTADLRVIPIDAGFALVARRGPSKLIVQASRIAHLHAGLPPARPNARLRGSEGTITENEGIRSAAWIEHGVAYTADLECAHAEAPECTDEGLVDLVDGLVYVGGAAPPVGGAP